MPLSLLAFRKFRGSGRDRPWKKLAGLAAAVIGDFPIVPAAVGIRVRRKLVSFGNFQTNQGRETHELVFHHSKRHRAEIPGDQEQGGFPSDHLGLLPFQRIRESKEHPSLTHIASRGRRTRGARTRFPRTWRCSQDKCRTCSRRNRSTTATCSRSGGSAAEGFAPSRS